MSIARIALPIASEHLFEYWLPQGTNARPGSIVKVALARRRLAGVVVECVDVPSVERNKLLAIDEVLDIPPLPAEIRELCDFVAGYYQVARGLAYSLAMPPLGKASRLRHTPNAAEILVARAVHSTHSLNDAQASAVSSIIASLDAFTAFLLHGITGSGKTDVYLAAVQACVARSRQALLLVPEINLTPQLVARVARALPDACSVALHSGLAAGQRRASWEAATNGNADVVLGTRLAVFTPMPRLGLIVVDEEHDTSYKQQDLIRYHARDVAIWRARQRDVPIVLGSATPSLESYANARNGRYARLSLPQRAGVDVRLPEVRLIPARGDAVRDGLSRTLIDAIGATLSRGEQSLLFVNRRGFSPSLKCAACGWEANCPRCSARLTAHKTPLALICHHCAHRERMPRSCPSCGNVDLLPLGHGTQRLEQTLTAAFPNARLARVDRDSTRRRDAFARVQARVERNEIDILVGTQMLAKGHDFPRLTLVGVVGADNALYSADFRATERLAALLLQVAGRAGRAAHRGEVLVQTDFPHHPLFKAVANHDYDAFAASVLDERAVASLPPFAHLALVSAEAHRRDEAERFLADAYEEATARSKALRVDVDVFDPVAAPLARRAGFERSQMLVRSRQRADLQALIAPLKHALEATDSRRVRWSIDVDPASLD
ncbi:MAG TPA: primosomal protein N' [Casimicrobiaceae bacterium]|nr:primosomal protein N' [Casimicrobiaceae bacterium]